MIIFTIAQTLAVAVAAIGAELTIELTITGWTASDAFRYLVAECLGGLS